MFSGNRRGFRYPGCFAKGLEPFHNSRVGHNFHMLAGNCQPFYRELGTLSVKNMAIVGATAAAVEADSWPPAVTSCFFAFVVYQWMDGRMNECGYSRCLGLIFWNAKKRAYAAVCSHHYAAVFKISSHLRALPCAGLNTHDIFAQSCK